MRAEEADKELISLRKRRARESQQNFSNAINKLTQSGSGNKAANTLFAERLQAEETAKKALDKINADNEKARVKDEIARGKKSRARSLREAKAQYRERERIATIANDYHTSTAALRPNKTAQEQRTHAQITKGLQEATTARQAHNVVRIRTNELALLKKSTRELAKQNMLMQRVKASFTEMVTGYATAFAAMGLAYSVNSIGQALESAENTMLSVSESKEDFDENQAFIREESYRLGVPLRTASANYSKMYAAKGSLSKEDTQQLFLGLAEQSTILGLSDEGVDRSMKAVQQMMSKGKITSEELKEQLGDVMPTGVPLMALAAKDAGITKNGTRQELYKMMEDGKVFSEEILPFFATRLRDAARANGALEKALNSNATAMKRMMNSAELAADVVFKGGWAEGSTELFQEIAEFFHDNEMALKSFGKIFGSLFKGLTIIVRSFNHLLQSLGTILDGFTTILGDASAALLLLLSPTVLAGVFSLEKAFVGVRTVLLSIGKILLRTVAPIIAIIAAIEEVVNLFTATKIGSVFHRGNPNVKKMSDEDKAKLSTPERWMVNFKEGFEDSIFSEINTALVSAKDFAKGFLENNSIEDIITNLFESLGVKITEYISKVDFASVFDGFFSNLWTIITTVYSTFGTTLKNLITLIAPLAFNILNELTRYLDGKLKEFLAKWDTQLIDSLTKFGDGISKFIDELWDKIKETIFGWVDGRREEAIKTGMQNAQNKVGALGDISSSNYQGYTKYTQPLQPTEQNINVSVELDGEKVGGVVVNTNAYNGATERKIKEVNGG